MIRPVRESAPWGDKCFKVGDALGNWLLFSEAWRIFGRFFTILRLLHDIFMTNTYPK